MTPPSLGIIALQAGCCAGCLVAAAAFRDFSSFALTLCAAANGLLALDNWRTRKRRLARPESCPVSPPNLD